jgi:hypothetical protein
MRLTKPSFFAALAVPVAALASTGCISPVDPFGEEDPLICTKIGYENGLAVEVNVPPEAGVHRFTVEAEHEVLSLDYEVNEGGLPIPACDADCLIEGDRLEIDPLTSHPPGLFVAIVRRRGQDIGPSQVTLSVSRGGSVLATADLTPRYRTREPNGPGCGVHVFANVELDAR